VSELNINFQWVSNAQSMKVTEIREIKATTDGFARMIVDEVALASSESAYKEARVRFIQGVRKAVLVEVSRMAMTIGRRFPLPDKYTGPHGQMSLFDAGANTGDFSTVKGMSETARRFGFQSTFDRESTNITWAKRTRDYMQHKRKWGKPQRWWEYSGDLKKDLGSKGEGFYQEIFGPVRVTFSRPPGRDARGRFTKHSNIVRTKAYDPSSGEDRGNVVNVTRSGQRGTVSADYEVGRLEVSVFGKITPRMLPALNGKTMNPKLAEPADGPGIAQLFPNGETKTKLLTTRQGERYRYALEPFVSWYLTRAIPNAVWRRTESLVMTGAGRNG
jgi:hypothetical protein